MDSHKRKLEGDAPPVTPNAKEKKARTKKTTPPKRPATFRPTASKAIQDRMTRVVLQRMYLVSHTVTSRSPSAVDGGGEGPEGSVAAATFAVLGSTGNVYDVNISCLPTCSCPDFAKHGQACKHLLFVFLKVLGLPSSNPIVWQKGLLPSEVAEAFAHWVEDRAVGAGFLANDKVRATYDKLAKGEGGDEEQEQVEIRNGDEDCPICFEAIEMPSEGKDKKTEALVVCLECRRPVHSDCFDRWKKSRKQAHASVTCVYCRTEWVEKSGVPGVKSPDGYVNLGELQGQSQTRDESTYADWFQNRDRYNHRRR